jgi:hypothetical protein
MKVTGEQPMTNQHPLTDEIIEEIENKFNCYVDDMRAAADWQLEQVIDWIETYLTAGDVIAEDLKKAMRPQQLENN